MCSAADCLERANLLGDRPLGGEPLDRARTVEAVHATAVADDELRVGRLRNRPAVADDQHVAIHAAGGIGDGLNPHDAIVERLRALRANRTARRHAHVRDDQIGAGIGHALRLGGVEDIRRGEQVHLVRQPDDVHFELIAHAGFLEGLPHVAVEQADGRKVLHAGKAERLQLFEEEAGNDERVGAVDAGEHGRPLHDGQDLVGHLLDDLVGVAVREQSGRAAAPGHPIAARSCRRSAGRCRRPPRSSRRGPCRRRRR